MNHIKQKLLRRFFTLLYLLFRIMDEDKELKDVFN